jgi:nucleoid DNA-binding protein
MANQGLINKQKIYERIEEETGVPKHKVEEAVKHEFSRTAELMASGDREKKEFPSIRLQYFGKFDVHPKRIEYLQNND